MVNLPKLKTHDIMTLTLATKNLYGCISGLHKSHLHKAHPKTADFANIIIKLYKMIRPSLHIVDGILSLEGNGPAKNGVPKKLGVVVIADDALSCDYAISKLLGLKDDFNPLIRQAKKEGLLEEDLEIVSEFNGEVIKDFKFPRGFILNGLPSPIISIVKGLFNFKPIVDRSKCVGCAKCVAVCPKGAVTLKGSKAVINYKQCIMCMCCSEMCEFGAIDLYESFCIKAIKFLHKCFR
jgi:ferredoxin